MRMGAMGDRAMGEAEGAAGRSARDQMTKRERREIEDEGEAAKKATRRQPEADDRGDDARRAVEARREERGC